MCSLWYGWCDLLRAAARGGVPTPLPLLLLLPPQAPGGVRPAGGAMRRRLRPLLLRAMCALPDVPGAQEPRRRPGTW